jgi:hypothetical protein
MMMDSSKGVTYMHNWSLMKFSKNHIQSMKCTSFLIDDVAYLIHT